MDSNHYKNVEFLMSAPDLAHCPQDFGAEVAFAGRSNAGKSSALNTLTQNTKLSRISKTPGRTQMLNFFALNNDKRLVDLPGYGYAKVPEKIKQKWQLVMQDYLQKRRSLMGIVLLMDIRHPFMPHDLAMLDWSMHRLPIYVLLTKSDKLKRGAAQNVFFSVQKRLQQSYPATNVCLFSALKKAGLGDLMAVVDDWLQIGTADP